MTRPNSTAWIVPAGTDSAPGAQEGDVLLRRDGDRWEVGQLGQTCTWLGTLAADLLPGLSDEGAPMAAPDQEGTLMAARGLASAEQHRGG